MNISVEIKAPELANAILSLASALGGKTQTANNAAPVQQQEPPQAIQQQAPVQQTQQAPTAVPTAPPVQQQQAPSQPQVQQQTVPTTTTAYTMDQLAVAATQLMDAGKQNDLLSLLASFGAQSLMQIPQEQYGTFATKLRELGARI